MDEPHGVDASIDRRHQHHGPGRQVAGERNPDVSTPLSMVRPYPFDTCPRAGLQSDPEYARLRAAEPVTRDLPTG